MLNTVLYYELAMKVPIPVGITVYLLTWGLGHLRCLVSSGIVVKNGSGELFKKNLCHQSINNSQFTHRIIEHGRIVEERDL